jgi:hypothetical protein
MTDEMKVPLVNETLPPHLALTMNESANQLWTRGTQRKQVSDLIKLEGRTIVINPMSDPELGADTSGAIDKQLLYAAFAIATGEIVSISEGAHLYKSPNPNKARYAHAGLFIFEDGEWHPYRWQKGQWVAMELNKKSQIWRKMQDKEDWLALAGQGAWAQIDLSNSPALLDYFAGLLTMSRDEARAEIIEHQRLGIIQKELWERSREANDPEVNGVTIEGEAFASVALKGIRVIATSPSGDKIKVKLDQLWINTLAACGFTMSWE